MTVFTCVPEWEAMLTCIYTAWSSRLGHANIRLKFEPLDQLTLFDEYVHVDPDPVLAGKVTDAVNIRISPEVYRELLYASMAYEPEVLDTIYRVMILGFAYGPNVLNMVGYRDVMHFNAIRKRVSGEAWSFVEFLRFHKAPGEVYTAHIEPRSRVLPVLADQFADRMPSEHWIIVDDTHCEAVIHPKDRDYYFRRLTPDELALLLDTEKLNDDYTGLWKVFFESTAIAERRNPACQLNRFPLWKRKHAVEFL